MSDVSDSESTEVVVEERAKWTRLPAKHTDYVPSTAICRKFKLACHVLFKSKP